MSYSPLKVLSEGNTSESSKNGDNYIPSIFRTLEFRLESIVEKINNIDNLNEAEIKNIILRQHSMLLNYDYFLKSDKTRRDMQILFTNKRFLKLFLDVIGLIQLTREEIICINKLAYDYYITKNKDEEVSNLLLQISNVVNNVTVIRLSGILGMRGARTLAMIANSSFREDRKVHRVNTFITKFNTMDLSVKNIIDIYTILFEKFTQLFIYTMIEVKQPNMNQDHLKKFDKISSAMIAMLDSLTSNDIKKVLYEYGYTLKLLKSDCCTVRFGLKSNSMKLSYPRIQEVIEDIEYSDLEGIKIP